MSIPEFNQLSLQQKKEELFRCCGSESWAAGLIAKFPFDSVEKVKAASDEIWFSLVEEDWKEAFSHHPKIGDLESLKKNYVLSGDWAKGEQSGVNTASEEIMTDLKKGNMEYEKKFGYIFIVCATGKSAAEMLEMLQARLINNPAYEINIAAEEQNKITHLRLEKLFS